MQNACACARDRTDIHVTGTMELLDGRTRTSNWRRSKKRTIFDFLNKRKTYIGYKIVQISTKKIMKMLVRAREIVQIPM